MFWESFSAEFLATLIGLIIGIPIALWLDRRNSETRSRKDAKDKLTALKEEINRNKELMQQIQTELTTDSVIDYNLQFSGWRTIAIDKLGSFLNFDLIRELSKIYYEFEIFSRKIDIQFDMEYSGIRTFHDYRETRRKLVLSIHLHIREILPACNLVINDIESELAKFRAS